MDGHKDRWTCSNSPAHDVHSTTGHYLGSDSDPSIRNQLARDSAAADLTTRHFYLSQSVGPGRMPGTFAWCAWYGHPAFRTWGTVARNERLQYRPTS
jgi:hypothetical protein